VHLNRLQQFVLIFNLATIGLYGWTIIEFLTRGASSVPGIMADLYLLLLAIDAGDKEIKRWHDKHKNVRRRGELFVLGWVGLAIITLLVELNGGREAGYVVPRELPSITGGVLIIYCATEYLKFEFKKRKRQAR